jgi:GTPase Era involved in 16S rRNA processing
MAQTSAAIVKIPRILIVGGSGEGKSSLVNLLSNENKTVVSSGARGCTLKCEDFAVRYFDSNYLLTDTVGFNEPKDGGAVPHKDAIKCLIKFASEHAEGFNLIVFVMKKGRITQSFQSTYDFFYEVLFSEEIPCILYISGSEHDDDMDEWYKHNKRDFGHRYKFCEVVSGTALVHKNTQLAEFLRPKQEETYKKVWEAILFNTLPELIGIKTEISFWLKAINFIYYYFSFGGTFFKSKVKADLEKQLRGMGIEEKAIRDIMTLIQ